MLNDQTANALNNIINAERIGKEECLVPASKIIEKILTILNEKGYLGTYKREKLVGGDKLRVNLIGKINKCGSIKPNYTIKYVHIEKFEKRFLPARGFGILIISTPQGIITNTEARKKRIGGKLLAYCY